MIRQVQDAQIGESGPVCAVTDQNSPLVQNRKRWSVSGFVCVPSFEAIRRVGGFALGDAVAILVVELRPPRPFLRSPQQNEVTTMQTAKQEALKAIQRLPDNVDTEEMIYQLYVLENVRRGQQDAVQGRTELAEEVLKDIQSW